MTFIQSERVIIDNVFVSFSRLKTRSLPHDRNTFLSCNQSIVGIIKKMSHHRVSCNIIILVLWLQWMDLRNEEYRSTRHVVTWWFSRWRQRKRNASSLYTEFNAPFSMYFRNNHIKFTLNEHNIEHIIYLRLLQTLPAIAYLVRCSTKALGYAQGNNMHNITESNSFQRNLFCNKISFESL